MKVLQLITLLGSLLVTEFVGLWGIILPPPPTPPPTTQSPIRGILIFLPILFLLFLLPMLFQGKGGFGKGYAVLYPIGPSYKKG